VRVPMEFFVRGIPYGQPRARAAAFAGHARVYNAKGPHDDWKAAVRSECLKLWSFDGGAIPWMGPLRVDLTFSFPRPKSHYRANGELKDTAPIWHTGKPDRDNADKLVLDALTSIGLWPDDKQVCDGRLRKFYSDATHPSGCLVRVSECVETT
jgi:crossover junction endodeoxyribonuclease RusA